MEVDTSLATTEWLDNEIGFVRNREVHNYLNKLLVNLSRSIYKAALETEIHRVVAKDYSAYPWQVFLLKTDKINAFSSGAGALYITEGLLDTLQTEAELAAVLCHEMAHQLLEHPRAALAKNRSWASKP